MTRFPIFKRVVRWWHAPLAGWVHFKRSSEMVARDSRWSASDIYSSVVYSSTNAFVPRPERFTASGVSGDIYRKRGRALVRAGMRDSRLRFPMSISVPSFSSLKCPNLTHSRFKMLFYPEVQKSPSDPTLVLYLWNGDPQIGDAVARPSRRAPFFHWNAGPAPCVTDLKDVANPDEVPDDTVSFFQSLVAFVGE
ncbi:hypothetical protein B0H13DRAFT_1897798 [Mycena leptocephala]|nr:hypothetical protein B0H13DRAFT_1897798 [Mycena leptocephala]